MASTLSRIPHKVPFVRGYSTAKKLAPIGGVPDCEPKQTKLPNKLVVASVDNLAAISRVAVVFRAGSRDEKSDNIGTAHTLRACAGTSSKKISQFIISRHIQQIGGCLSVHADREVIAYVFEGLPETLEDALPILGEVATNPAFKPWEVSETTSRLRLERKQLSPQLRAVDVWHKAAFRTGLGNSLYCPKYQFGKISSETLQHFVTNNCTAGRGAVVGVGINQRQLEEFASSLKLGDGVGEGAPAKYRGGEIRVDKGTDFAYVVVGGEGTPASNPKAAGIAAITQRALGINSQVAYGNAAGPLGSALGAGSQGAISAVNFNYSDAGLLGVLIAAPAKEAGTVVQNVVKVLKDAKVTDKDVQRAKNQLKANILASSESGATLIHTLGWQAVQSGSVRSATDLVKEVDSISTQDVTCALKNATEKLSIAAFGNLSTVPYLDDLS